MLLIDIVDSYDCYIMLYNFCKWNFFFCANKTNSSLCKLFFPIRDSSNYFIIVYTFVCENIQTFKFKE